MTRTREPSAIEADELRRAVERLDRRLSLRFATFQGWLDGKVQDEQPDPYLAGFRTLVERTVVSFENELASLKRRTDAIEDGRA